MEDSELTRRTERGGLVCVEFKCDEKRKFAIKYHMKKIVKD